MGRDELVEGKESIMMSRKQSYQYRGEDPPQAMTKEERIARRNKCIAYIRQYATLDAARDAAAKDKFACNTSVWIGACGELLASGGQPGDRKKGIEA